MSRGRCSVLDLGYPHRLRVAYAAPSSSRLSPLGDLSESSITRNGDDVWTWSSKDNEVTHATIDPEKTGDPDANGGADRPKDLPADAPETPQEAAQRILAESADTTDVSVATDTRVAGRQAYELVLQPKDERSLISSVRIAIDGIEHVALRVQVFAGEPLSRRGRSGSPKVDFAVPPASEFEFTPPAGAKLTEVQPEDHGTVSEADREAAEKAREQAEPEGRRRGADQYPGRQAAGRRAEQQGTVDRDDPEWTCGPTWPSCPRRPVLGAPAGCWPGRRSRS